MIALSRMLRMTRALLTTILMALGAGDAMALEKLSYEVLESDGPIELRRIEPHQVAETWVDGEFDAVGSEGFRRLVAYIGGANRGGAEIAMTAPVGQQAEPQKIAMTAPVGQQRVGERYRITFVMPAEYAPGALPVPTDERVAIRDEPARTVAAIRYSGTWSERRYQRHEDELRSWIAAQGLEVVGEPVWARYDPPFMPWFLRRNEIFFEVRER